MNFTEDAMRMEGNHVEETEYNNGPDEEEDSASDSSSDESDSHVKDQEDETYVRFVRSVFCDDYSGCSNTDDDDEEEYIPDPKEGDDMDSDDDGDRDLVRVQNRELRELVDGCWQTIIGEAPQVNSSAKVDEADSVNVGSPTKRRPAPSSGQHRGNNTAGDAFQANGAGSSRPPSAINNDNSDGLYDDLGDDLDLSLLSPIGSPVKTAASATSSNQQKAKIGIIAPTSGTNVISNMVTKLFSENETSEVCIEGGLPVHAVRKIVARQLSMATQLLVQILLQADEQSDCFTKGYTSLMELSNLREAALKKATLVEMNYKNATAIRNHTLDLQLAKQRDNILSLNALMGSDRSDYNENEGDSGSDIDVEASDSNSSSLAVRNIGAPSSSSRASTKDVVVQNINSVARRLTRSAMAKTTAVHTVFNVPILAKVSTLFDMIDMSRRVVKAELANASNVNNRSRPMIHASEMNPAEMRTRTLTAIKGQVYHIMPQLSMRPWRCLLPNAHYPLPANLVRTLDATTLMGRCLFTPAEDDLLLRGIMNVGEASWEQVRAQFMPSKEAQLLQFRYSQMTSLSATYDDNNFKRYQALAVAYRNRDTKWSNEEELDLLRAYQAFGERWPLMKVFFLPHRKTQQMRLKWMMLQKVWQKAFQGQSVYKVGFIKRELTPAMRSFLEMLSPPPVERTVAAASPTLTPLSSVVVPVDITQESSAAFTGETLLGKSTDKTGGGASGSTGASGGARGNGSEKATQFGPIAASTVKSTAMPVLPPPPKIAIVPPYLGPPVGSQATTAAASASLGAGQSAGYPGMPMGMGIPGMPPGMQMPPGMPPGMSPGMPLSMYPYSMPFMMPPPPPFMQQPAKIPTTPAEFMQYQQQQYFQYQQYMYQMFMMQQSQQPFQLNQGAVPHTAAAGAPHNMMMPGQPGMPMPMPPQMHMPLPNAPQSAPMQGAPDPNSSQRAEDPSSFSAGASGASSASSSFNLDGPLLLKNVGTGGNKTSKRVRKFNQVDTSPSASRSLYNTEETDTAEPSAKDISAVTAAAGAASEAVGASLPFDENSRSISFLQEDSLFFLESGSFGAGGADSIPFIGADSNAGVGGSAAAVSTGTSSNINNHNNQTQQQKHAADARASPKGAPSQPSAVAPPAKSGMVRSPQPSPRKPALKSILSKPEKKKIKPTLITSASVVTSANSAFQSGKTVRAAPTLAPTTAPPPKQTPATASAATSAAASVAPAPAPISPAPASSVASSSAVEVIELDGRSLMMDPDGLSRLWRDADSEESGSLSMGLGMGMDMGMSMNIHPSMLGDISMLDASKFAFSNFPQVTNGGAAAKSEDGDQEKRRGKRKAQELEARPHNGTKATRTDPAAQDFSSPCNSRASRYSRHSRSSAAQPHLDDNMSLLGDFFNDGEIVGSPLSNGGSFSHLSNLVSLHGPASSSVPKSTSRSGGDRGAKQREKGKNSDIPAVYDAAEKKNKKEETAVPAPAARAATKPAESARLFQNIGAMSTSLGRNLTPRSSSVTAENERFSGNGSVGSGGGVFAGVAGRSGLAGFSSSERFSPNGSNASFASNGSVPKKAKSALFAEIMAKAHQHSSQN